MSWEDDAKAQSVPVADSWEDSARAASVPERASDAEIEAARPKNMAEIAWSGARNMLAGGAKSISNLAAGAGGLLMKGLDKAGVTRGAEDAAQRGHERMNGQIDAALGTETPTVGGQLMQSLGEAGAGLAIPVEKAVPLATKAVQAVTHLPPYLANLGAKAAVNTGFGAAEGEGVGHPVAGAVTGLVGTGLAEGAKALGGQIIKSYIKGGHKGAAEGLDVPWFLNQEMGGTGPAMAEKVDTRLQGLKDTQSQIIAQKGNLPTPILQAFQNVENKINTSQAMAKNIGSLPAARSQLKEYLDDVIPLLDQQTGEGSLNLAWEMKKKAGSDATALYRAANSGGDVKGMTKQGVSAMVVNELNAILEHQAPELVDLNPEFSKLIPVAKALERRNRIAGQHNPIGLDELAAVDAGVQFMTHGTPAGMALPLVQKASKSPYFGQLTRDAAKYSPRMNSLWPAGQGAVDLITGNRGQE